MIGVPASGTAEARGRRRVAVAMMVAIVGSLGFAATATGADASGRTPARVGTTAVSGTLNAVSCTTATSCEAVGSYVGAGDQTLTLAEAWNGTTWTVQPTPNPAGGSNNVLFGVSCPAAQNCVAVGAYFAGHGNALLAELWNGTTWTIQTAPLPTGALGGALLGVSCAASGECTAVGNYANSSNTNQALAEAWNGTNFAPESVPNAVGGTTSAFVAVSCSPSPSVDCEAVGFNYLNGFDVAETLAEGWNGTSWTVQTTPAPDDSDSGSYPSGVSCSAPRVCTSVGFAYGGGGSLSTGWAQRWNGKVWTNQKTRKPTSATASALTAISCSASPSTVCTAAGYSLGSSGFSTFAAGRDGKRWSVQKTPEPKGSTSASFGGVWCPSPPGACTAVGSSTGSAGVPLTLAEGWDGTKWTIEKTPVP